MLLKFMAQHVPTVLKALGQTLQTRLLKLLTKKPKQYTADQLYLDYNLQSYTHVFVHMGVIVSKYRHDLLPSAVLANINKPNNGTEISTHIYSKHVCNTSSNCTTRQMISAVIIVNYHYYLAQPFIFRVLMFVYTGKHTGNTGNRHRLGQDCRIICNHQRQTCVHFHVLIMFRT